MTRNSQTVLSAISAAVLIISASACSQDEATHAELNLTPIEVSIAAVETVDACVGQVVDATLSKGGSLVVTADHGNCEQMIDPATGGPHTAHTTYDVPLIVVDPDVNGKTLRRGGRLADIAPTVLELLGLAVPDEMTGEPLLKL